MAEPESSTSAPADSAPTPAPRRREPALVTRLRARRATHEQRHIVVRIAWAAAAFVLAFAGLAMLVLPGPAFVVLPIALAMLSLEFAWANRLLERALREADEARERAARASRTKKAFGVLGIGAAIAAVATFGALVVL